MKFLLDVLQNIVSGKIKLKVIGAASTREVAALWNDHKNNKVPAGLVETFNEEHYFEEGGKHKNTFRARAVAKVETEFEKKKEKLNSEIDKINDKIEKLKSAETAGNIIKQLQKKKDEATKKRIEAQKRVEVATKKLEALRKKLKR